jgi:N-alpha-acetyltransferase 10/11
MLTLVADARRTPARRPGEIPPPYPIRGCTDGDADALGRLYCEAHAPGAGCGSADEAIDDMRATFAGEYGELWQPASLVAERDGEPVAAVLTVRQAPWPGAPDCPFVVELFTARPYRRRGLGRTLVRRCLAAAGATGRPRLALRVAETNSGALRLYESLRFQRWRP